MGRLAAGACRSRRRHLLRHSHRIAWSVPSSTFPPRLLRRSDSTHRGHRTFLSVNRMGRVPIASAELPRLLSPPDCAVQSPLASGMRFGSRFWATHLSIRSAHSRAPRWFRWCVTLESVRLSENIMQEVEEVSRSLGMELPVSIDQRIAGRRKVGEHKTSMPAGSRSRPAHRIGSPGGRGGRTGERVGLSMTCTRTVYNCTKLLAERAAQKQPG